MGKALTIILVVAVVALLCLCGFLLLPNLLSSIPQGSSSGGGGSGLFFDENAGDFQEQIIEADRGIAIPGWEKVVIAADSQDVIVDFYNPQANDGYYYMTFELKLADGESLYKSGLVKAGQHIQKITLSRSLPKGTYDAVLHVQPYTADDAMTPTNNADMKLKLVAE